MHTLHVDCHGRCAKPEIVAHADGFEVRFVYDDALKSGREFSYALFVDDAAAGRDHLRYPFHRRVWLLQESPIRAIYDRADRLAGRFCHVFTHSRRLLARGAPFRRFYFGTSWLGDTDTTVNFPKSEDVSFIGSVLHGDDGGYGLRKRVASALVEHPDVECFGYGIREIPTKIDGLGAYRFSVALENTREDWYFSEKLIDCFLTDTVPVYWGCPGIGDVFDQRGMLRFERVDDLLELVGELTEERHRRMLPFVRINKRVAREYRLDTLQAQHERLAAELLGRIGPLEPVGARPRVVDRMRSLWRTVRS